MPEPKYSWIEHWPEQGRYELANRRGRRPIDLDDLTHVGPLQSIHVQNGSDRNIGELVEERFPTLEVDGVTPDVFFHRVISQDGGATLLLIQFYTSN